MSWWQEHSGRGMCLGGDQFLLKASLRLLCPGGTPKDEPDPGTSLPSLGSRGVTAHVRNVSHSCILKPNTEWRLLQKLPALGWGPAATSRRLGWRLCGGTAKKCWLVFPRQHKPGTASPLPSLPRPCQSILSQTAPLLMDVVPRYTDTPQTFQNTDKVLNQPWLNSCLSVCFEKWSVCWWSSSRLLHLIKDSGESSA